MEAPGSGRQCAADDADRPARTVVNPARCRGSRAETALRSEVWPISPWRGRSIYVLLRHDGDDCC